MNCREVDAGSGSVVTTGTFDGVHRGHRLLVQTLVREAEERGLRPLALTFDRHPLSVIAPERAPRSLQSAPERDAMLRALGADVEELHFDETMRAMTAREWMEALRDRFGARVLLIGYDNRFGCDGRTMTTADFVRLGRESGLDVLRASELPGVSSSAVRLALETGDIAVASDLLGYPWSLTGKVEHGRSVGRQIGFRTANLVADPAIQLPGSGVYASQVTLPGGDVLYGLTNIGVRPTFGEDGEISVETFIPGFEGDLYGQRITLRPVRRLRDERKFDSVAELQEQITKDLKELKNMEVYKHSQ